MKNSRKKYDVVILTDARYVNPDQNCWFKENIVKEDGMLMKALEDKGLKTGRLSWDDPHFKWSDTRYIIFRSTWDYFERYDEFSEWLERTSKLVSMINPYETIRWNIDKHYLHDLSNNGIPVIPTVFIEPGEQRALQELVRDSDWTDLILKPAVSGGARHTYRLNPGNIEEHETVFRELIKTESMLLQEFQNSVISEGEIALILFGGKYSHSILKRAKEGDFRVQDEFGGSVHNYEASPEEIDFAENVISVCDPIPVYARVDVIKDNNNELSVTELELIEPELWFRKYPRAAELFVEAFVEFIGP